MSKQPETYAEFEAWFIDQLKFMDPAADQESRDIEVFSARLQAAVAYATTAHMMKRGGISDRILATACTAGILSQISLLWEALLPDSRRILVPALANAATIHTAKLCSVGRGMTKSEGDMLITSVEGTGRA